MKTYISKRVHPLTQMTPPMESFLIPILIFKAIKFEVMLNKFYFWLGNI